MKSVPEPIISAVSLKDLLHQQEVKLIDARQGGDARQRYLEHHLRGALWIDLERDLSQPGDPQQGGRHPLPKPKKFGQTLGKLGITPDSHVIIYDDTSGAIAGARIWWMLKAAGHPRVQVLDGGLKAAIEAGLELRSGNEEANPAPPYTVEAWQLPLVNIEEVKKISESGTRKIIDVRAEVRYLGQTEPIDPVAGHIPGAINIPYQQNLDREGKFKNKAELRKLFSEITKEGEVNQAVVHCGSGVTACHTILAMDIASLDLPALYVGSWSEWCRVGG